VPLPLITNQDIDQPIAGLGAEMKNAFCLAFGRMAFMSQYIGDMHGYENFERFKKEFYSYQKVANIFPVRTAHDLHPDYATTKMAKSLDCPTTAVQHHHAHQVSVMGEYNLSEPTLGLICDGTGYGEDGKIWGFEYLLGNAAGYVRKGHLAYLPLPGGDAGSKYPLRIAYAYLRTILSEREWHETGRLWEPLSKQETSILEGQLKSGFQVFQTSSAGRLFDAVSGLLGICTKVTYEGQAAIELESQAAVWLEQMQNTILPDQKTVSDLDQYRREALERLYRAKSTMQETIGKQQTGNRSQQRYSDNQRVVNQQTGLYQITLAEEAQTLQIKVDPLLKGIVNDVLSGAETGKIAYKFHYALAAGMLETALMIEGDLQKMIIAGGVFQNKLLTEILLDLAKEIELEIYYPTQLPSGDGGLAYGQILVANQEHQQHSQ
jgi:hydrogenase maturation protein HypF